MRQITEQQILALAPNAAAASNGRKISQNGGFIRLEQAPDDSFYLGECTGSGKNNYITTADFLDENAPVFRCTCPSRQFPCKHSLGLLYEILAQKSFAACQIPEDILKKREKKLGRSEKNDKAPAEGKEPVRTPARSKAARTKKLKKQLEGLDLASKLIHDLMKAGLGTMGGAALDTYRQLAKQLGDYYLPGPQRLLNRLILEIAAFQKDGQDAHYETAMQALEKFHTLVKKSTQYISAKLETGEVEQDDSLLYEELGGIWKLAQLEELGMGRQDVRLAQLAFWVTFDEARKEYIDTGCWADLNTGEVSMTYNYRPLKALKYVKQEDTVFGVAQVPLAVYYPGEGNKRVRWEAAAVRPLEKGDLERLKARACVSLAAEAKAAKNTLKNAMADPVVVKLIAFSQIGRTKQGLALQDAAGDTILLGDMPGMEAATERIELLPDPELLRDKVLAGGFYYDGARKRLMLQPYSILTEEKLIRLLY